MYTETFICLLQTSMIASTCPVIGFVEFSLLLNKYLLDEIASLPPKVNEKKNTRTNILRNSVNVTLM